MQLSSTKTIVKHSDSQTTDVVHKAQSLRGAGRKASISQEELFQATLSLIGPEKSISSLSLREIAREAGIAPNSFYRHFKDIDELAVALINRAGLVLRQIIREARLHANQHKGVVRSSIEIFLQQLDADEGNLGLLLREGYTGSPSYKKAVEQQLTDFQHELQDDLVRLGRLTHQHVEHADIVAKAITQLVFHMGAKVLDLSSAERQVIAEDTILMIRMIIEGAKQIQLKKDSSV
jgi:AcrR family transcriptional regulator